MKGAVCVWCVVCYTVGLLESVSAQPGIDAWIVTPEADRKEGGQVQMRCVATNLESNHTVEWMTADNTLRWGGTTVTANRRFQFHTTHVGSTGTISQTTQDFTITDLQRDDTDEYVCNVREPLSTGGTRVVASSSVMLSVLYFPSESFPICSPDGPITVDIGTELTLQCSSEAGNGAVMMEVFQSYSSDSSHQTWASSTANDTITRSSELILGAKHDISFHCLIFSASFPRLNGSCDIGPITVRAATDSPTETTTGELDFISLSNAILIACACAGGTAILVFIMVLIMTCRCRLCRICKTNLPSPTKSHSYWISQPENSDFSPTDSDQYQPRFIYHPDRETTDNSPIYENLVNLRRSKASTTEPDEAKLVKPGGKVDGSTTKNSPPLYAKPHKLPKRTSESNTSSANLHDTTTQGYANPAFDSTNPDDTTVTFEEASPQVKPSGQARLMTQRSVTSPRPTFSPPPPPSSTSYDSGYPWSRNDTPSSYEESPYANVSFTENQMSNIVDTPVESPRGKKPPPLRLNSQPGTASQNRPRSTSRPTSAPPPPPVDTSHTDRTSDSYSGEMSPVYANNASTRL